MIFYELLGHTPDGHPVYVNQFDRLIGPGGVYTRIEIGHTSIELDHLDPELIPALRRSLLSPNRQRAA